MNNNKAEYVTPDAVTSEVKAAQVFAGSPGGEIPDMPFGSTFNGLD